MDGENNGKNPIKWMIWGGKNPPILGNTHISVNMSRLKLFSN